MQIRTATMDDALRLRDIYAPYVEQTAITFEYEVPGVEEFRRRIAETLERYPWLVAEENGKLLGYAYAGAFKSRAAYQWAVETSIYLDMQQRGQGIGRLLHEALEEALRRQGFLNMNACIAYADSEDEFLSQASVRFHQRMGYSMCAHFHQCGRKFNHWYDMVWMEKLIGEHR